MCFLCLEFSLELINRAAETVVGVEALVAKPDQENPSYIRLDTNRPDYSADPCKCDSVGSTVTTRISTVIPVERFKRM